MSIDCHRCRHYFVTWEAGKPHGCRILGFKGPRLPSAVVRSHSEMECLYYEEKQRWMKKDEPSRT